jgi:hypothetical protein
LCLVGQVTKKEFGALVRKLDQIDEAVRDPLKDIPEEWNVKYPDRKQELKCNASGNQFPIDVAAVITEKKTYE